MSKSKAEAVLKEEYDKHVAAHPNQNWVEFDDADDAVRIGIQAMHTYAAGFAEWIRLQGYQHNGDMSWSRYENGGTQFYTTAQLMEIYDGEK